ncbi:MAG: hypothetical protein LBB93_04140 [Elusimicrobiota bacterium]|jgi:hypothetical protein|nr:hypothetical protein [Elusimicrobiota bacterium]
MKPLNNEQVGISAEIAIADVFNVPIEPSYRSRGVPQIIASLKTIVDKIFSSNNIPDPVEHIATEQNPVDFILDDKKTLSVKTNKQQLGKVAPQRIGQASSKTWFFLLADLLNIDEKEIPKDYKSKTLLFKVIALSRSDELLTIYWENMFDCDFLVHIFNVVDKNDILTNKPEYMVSTKMKSPVWKKEKISFTKRTLADWGESNTVKYDGITIGEYQIHNNRDNFKFRFNIKGISDLINSGKLTVS